MLVTFKTLAQEKFQVDLQPTDTIREAKSKIHKQKGDLYHADNVKLIYSGKLLHDDQTIEDAKIEENKFVVVMVTPAKRSPSVQSHSSTSTGAASAASAASTGSTVPTRTGKPPSSGVAPATENQPVPPPPQVALSADQERQVTQIMSMGYPRDQVLAALHASFFNSERAVEYLIDGLPGAGATVQQQPPPPAAPAAAPADEQEDEEEEGEQGDPLDVLRQHPAFAQMRRMVHENPGSLPQLIQQMGQANPRILNIMASNPEKIVEVFTAPEEETEQETDGGQKTTTGQGTGGAQGTGPGEKTASGQKSGSGQAVGGGKKSGIEQKSGSGQKVGGGQKSGGEQKSSGGQAVGGGQKSGGEQKSGSGQTVGGGQKTSGGQGPASTAEADSAAEREAIERLTAMGFPEDMVRQAYYACEKNENTAANLLLQQSEDGN